MKQKIIVNENQLIFKRKYWNVQQDSTEKFIHKLPLSKNESEFILEFSENEIKEVYTKTFERFVCDGNYYKVIFKNKYGVSFEYNAIIGESPRIDKSHYLKDKIKNIAKEVDLYILE